MVKRGKRKGDWSACQVTIQDLRGGIHLHRCQLLTQGSWFDGVKHTWKINEQDPHSARQRSSYSSRSEASDGPHATPDLPFVVPLLILLPDLHFKVPCLVLSSSLSPSLKALFLAFRMALMSFVTHIWITVDALCWDSVVHTEVNVVSYALYKPFIHWFNDSLIHPFICMVS